MIKTNRVWVPKLKKVVCSHDVVFKLEVMCNLRTDITVVEPKMTDKSTSEENLNDTATSVAYESLDEEEKSEDDDQASRNQKIRTS